VPFEPFNLTLCREIHISVAHFEQIVERICGLAGMKEYVNIELTSGTINFVEETWSVRFLQHLWWVVELSNSAYLSDICAWEHICMDTIFLLVWSPISDEHVMLLVR
jgi:hypothetical protein